MRHHLVLATVIALPAILTACKADPAPSPPTPPQAEPSKTVSSEPREVVLWHSYREDEKTAVEQVVDAFNKGHDDIRLKALNVPYDAFVDKITIATPRGQGPDIFIFAHNLIGDWVDNYHILEPISQRVGAGVLRRFIPATVKALVYKQSLYGLPMAFKSLALFYDPALVDSPPTTTDELVDKALAATDAEKGTYGLVYEASLLYFNAPFIHGFGASILDGAGRPNVDEQPMIDALSFVKGLMEKGVMPRGVNSAMVASLFNEGKAAMVINGPWFLGEIDDGRTFDVALLPGVGETGHAKPFLGSEAVFMSAFSKQKDAALEVMLFLTTDKSAMTRLRTGRQTVANDAVYHQEEVRKDRVISVFRAQAENCVLMSSRPEMQAIWSTMDMAINRSVFGEVDPRDALAEAQKKIEADIAKMRK